MATLRCAERTWALRESGISDDDCTYLGMYGNARVCNKNSPLLSFAEELSKVRSDIPLTLDGEPVVPGVFDPYRGNIVAPDHLLSGVAQDMLTLCFALLPNDSSRKEMDGSICEALAENGLYRQRSVYSAKGKGLHTMRLSDLFCVLCVSLGVFRAYVHCSKESRGIQQKTLETLGLLHSLVGLTYWWPIAGVHAPQHVRNFQRDDRES